MLILNSRQIRQFCQLDSDSKLLIERAMDKLGLSARAHLRILKISRTITDLAGEDRIRSDHIAEAIQYKSLDRRIFS